MFVLCLFFFQAEDGIRDLVRSRGLGDVYKRQLLNTFLRGVGLDFMAQRWLVDINWALPSVIGVDTWRGIGSVSYTHLTLPTSDLV